MDSNYSEFKTTMGIRQVGADTQVTSATNLSPQSRIKLDRANLTTEHRVILTASQSYAVAPTGVDIRRAISNIALETDDGKRYDMGGDGAVDLALFTSQALLVQDQVLQIGVSTVRGSFDIHHFLHDCKQDMATALETSEMGSLDLVITWATKTDNLFTGGTQNGEITYNAVIEAVEYPEMSRKNFQTAVHVTKRKVFSGTVAGIQPDLELSTGGSMRFLMVHAYDLTGATPALSNGVLSNLTLKIGDKVYRATTFKNIQVDNAIERNFSRTGVAVFDFGDDMHGFLDLTQAHRVVLQPEVVTGAPASWRVVVHEDYVRAANK